TIFGGLLTVLAMFGLVINAVPRLRLNPSRALAAGLYLWLAVNVAALMANPLPWQRYYLPLIPVVTLLAGSALLSLTALVRRAPTARWRASAAPVPRSRRRRRPRATPSSRSTTR
ncbi:MAG TPA: hypothetical protein PLM09_18085, partial [Casimicrobiaceae bacterium]|nr:hypothetical protein [Casimicrobiaceae bacterium]